MLLFLSPSSSAGVESLPKIAFLWGKRPHCLTTSLHASSMQGVLQCTWPMSPQELACVGAQTVLRFQIV